MPVTTSSNFVAVPHSRNDLWPVRLGAALRDGLRDRDRLSIDQKAGGRSVLL
jgi:hypothetical protein